LSNRILAFAKAEMAEQIDEINDKLNKDLSLKLEKFFMQVN